MLIGSGWAEKDHVLLPGDEVQGGEVGDQVAFQSAGVVEVELLQALAGREPGGPDSALSAVGVAGGDLTLQAGRQVFLMGPGLGPSPLGEPGRRIAQRGRFQRSGQKDQLAGQARLAVTDFVADSSPVMPAAFKAPNVAGCSSPAVVFASRRSSLSASVNSTECGVHGRYTADS